MRLRHCVLLLVPVCCSSVACSINVIVHDEQAAAATAGKFADLAFVKSEYASARALFSPELEQAVSAEKFADTVDTMHPKARPTEVKATEFEPLPGQRAMNIYLKGMRDGEAFYYRLLMVGDKGAGYKVQGLWRGPGPYPPSARKSL